ncbi:MAG: hypothetical protein QG625_3597 [Cyanobacteriota bacterium erpe_2018_sw_39hr_WHONDRS-SW48-000098_B_bin.30]|jgi:hypothetical protein|nr:hypothetical protein [Cyanobacteriota bacterium erpe_2018_sw_39hr_WHONDRS-SW48-000098_B_bin.30]
MDRENFSDYARDDAHPAGLEFPAVFVASDRSNLVDTSKLVDTVKLVDTSVPTDCFPGQPGVREIPISEAGQKNAQESLDYTRLTSTGDGRPSKIGPFELTPGQIKDWGRATTKDDLKAMVAGGKLTDTTANMLLEGKHHQVVLEMLQYGQKITPDLLQRFVPGDLQQAVKAYIDKK